MEGVNEGRVAVVEHRYVDGVNFHAGAAGALLAGGGAVDTSRLVSTEALMSADVGEVEGGKREAGRVHVVEGESGRCADWVVVAL